MHQFVVWIVLVPIFLLQSLTACSPKVILPGEPAAASRLTNNTFISFDGAELPLRTWRPEHNPKAVFIALHGFNDYSNFIKDTALVLNEHGIAVYSYDQRGFGEAPQRGMWSGTMAFVLDLQAIIPLVKKRHPGIPIYILGESMGGSVVMVAMADADQPEVNGVILVAPALWTRSTMPFYQRWVLWLGAHIIPWKTVTGESLDIIASDNFEMLRELGRDPLIIKKTRIDAVYGLTNLMDAAYHGAINYPDIPTLILYGAKDEVVPKLLVFDIFQRPPGDLAHRTFLFYKDGYHMLLRDLNSAMVINDIIAWLHDPSAKPPSVHSEAAENVYTDTHVMELAAGR